MNSVLAQDYLEEFDGNEAEAIAQLVRDLMQGDPKNFKRGYTRENAIMAAAEVFEMTTEGVEDIIDDCND